MTDPPMSPRRPVSWWVWALLAGAIVMMALSVYFAASGSRDSGDAKDAAAAAAAAVAQSNRNGDYTRCLAGLLADASIHNNAGLRLAVGSPERSAELSQSDAALKKLQQLRSGGDKVVAVLCPEIRG